MNDKDANHAAIASIFALTTVALIGIYLVSGANQQQSPTIVSNAVTTPPATHIAWNSLDVGEGCTSSSYCKGSLVCASGKCAYSESSDTTPSTIDRHPAFQDCWIGEKTSCQMRYADCGFFSDCADDCEQRGRVACLPTLVGVAPHKHWYDFNRQHKEKW